MGKSRSPLLGYNHNVRYNGRIYHIQTEDSGPGNPHLFTHLFYEGTILATKKHDYDGEASEDIVRSLMQGQHKALMKELKQALHDQRIAEFFSTRGETAVLLEQPETQAPAEGPGATTHKALDLDAIPAPATEPDPPPPVEIETTLPPELPEDDVTPQPEPIGDGVPVAARRVPSVRYAVRGSAPERPFDHKGRPEQIPKRSGTHPMIPAAGAKRPPGPPAHARTSAPVVVLQPPTPRRAGVRPPTRNSPSAEGVVVQRQVVVGVGGVPPSIRPQPRPRGARPVYIVGSTAPPGSSGRTPPPVRPPTAAQASESVSPTDRAFEELTTEKSLDEVILAYLSEEDPSKKK